MPLKYEMSKPVIKELVLIHNRLITACIMADTLNVEDQRRAKKMIPECIASIRDLMGKEQEL